MTEGTHTLVSLPKRAQEALLIGHVVPSSALEAYRVSVRAKELGTGGGLFSSVSEDSVHAPWETTSIIWATEATEGDVKHKFADPIKASSLASIKPRVDKTREEQKRRVKAKAEVFTPSWVCNLQNNLIDNASLYENAFNVTKGPADKEWVPNGEDIRFTPEYSWAHYVTENRLEMTCGEAPYLVSRYDTVTGSIIPVRSDRGWERIGLLDRKLRVVSENVLDPDEWVQAALYALRATYGFEWQGDNLLLARLNVLNTLEDYHREVWDQPLPEALLLEAAEIVSWNLWQMDGLKMVKPESCSPTCGACVSKARGGHEGAVSVVKFGTTVRAFESLLPSSMMASVKKQGSTGEKPSAGQKKTPVLKPSAPTSSLFG